MDPRDRAFAGAAVLALAGAGAAAGFRRAVTYPVDGICYTALSVEVKCGTSARISKPPLGSVRY